MVKGKRTLSIVAGALWLAGCTSVEAARMPSTALDHAAASTTWLGSWAQQATDQHASGLNGLRLVADGRKALALRASLAAYAQKSLDVQTYILEDDWASHVLLEQMLHAAQRGVRVRLLLDDTASLGKQRMLAAFDSHPRIEVRVFNPVPIGRGTWLSYHLALVADFDRRHRRMHNKLWLADNAAGLTGGRNIGNEYFDVAEELNFDDLDILAIGPVVNALSGSFDVYWNHALAVPLRRFVQAPAWAWCDMLADFANDVGQMGTLEASDLTGTIAGESGRELLASLAWAPAIALWDLPEKLEADGYPAMDLTLLGQLEEAFLQLQQRLLLVSPYVVPTQAGLDYQTLLAERGIELTILTNALEATDLASLHGAYAPWRPALLASGARLFEMRAQPAGKAAKRADGHSSLHTKAMAFDDARIFIGSLNADPRAVWWNSEVGLLVDSPELGRQLWALAERGMDPSRSYQVTLTEDGRLAWQTEQAGRRVTLEEEPGSLWRKFRAWAIRLLPIDHLL